MCVADPAWFVKRFIPPLKTTTTKNKTTLLRLHSYLKSIANHAQVCMHFSDRESQGFIGFWAVARYEGGWVGKMSKAKHENRIRDLGVQTTVRFL